MGTGIKRASVIVMVAMLAGCGSSVNEGPSQEDVRNALTRYGQKVQSTERIACKASPDKPGFICDFKSTTCSAFAKKCDTSLQRTGRFVEVGENWMFMGDITDPSRGYVEPTPTPSLPTLVTDLGGTDDNSVVATARPSAPAVSAAKPTVMASPTPRSTPTSAIAATAKPGPVPKPAPSPDAAATLHSPVLPAGVNRTWLSGRWGGAKGDCAARRAMNFGAGGGFYGKHGIGTWLLKGKIVTIAGKFSADDTSFIQVLPIERVAKDQMTLEGKRYLRCDN